MPQNQPFKIKSYSPLGFFSQVLKDPAEFLLEKRQLHGDLFQFRLGMKNVVFVGHPDDLKKVFLDKKDVFLKSSTRSSFGNSVLTSEGKKWLELRKSAQGFFQFPNLDAMMKDVDRLTQESFKQFESKDHRTFSVGKYFDSLIETLVMKLFFNIEGDSNSANLGAKMNFLSDNIIKMGLFPKTPPKWFPLFGVKEFFTTLDDFNSLVMEKYDRALMQESKCPFQKFASFLEKDITERKDISTQLLSFFFAGFETTANALVWTFLQMNKNPEIKKQLRAEVSNFDLNNYQSYTQLLQGLPWTKACLLEGMRLFPPVWFRTRTAIETTELSGALIEKGSLVWVSQYVTHRHPDFWNDPEKFDPSRFLDESKMHPFQYFPFSLGRNICQGRDLAMLEMIIIFARFFQRFDTDLASSKDHEVRPLARVSLRPEKEFFAILRDQ